MKREPSDEVLLALARLFMDVSLRAADEMGALSPVQLRALTVLRSRSEGNLAALADSMGSTVSTASRLIDRLVSAGWVHRRMSSQTRREVSLTLTEAGQALLRRYDERRVVELRRWLAQLPVHRRDAVAAVLTDPSACAARL
jgi:DNA-binding MarR family transcriptional regulator